MRGSTPHATRTDLVARAAESVAAAGALARLVSKTASSPALQAQISSFAEYEQTIESTNEMLHRVNDGLLALDESVTELEESITEEPTQAT